MPAYASTTDDGSSQVSTTSPYFLDALLDIRRGDAVRGRSWWRPMQFSTTQATQLGHVDRALAGLQTVLALLQASETCRRRRPEDFGIGDDHHEGLVYAARELAEAMRERMVALERQSSGTA